MNNPTAFPRPFSADETTSSFPLNKLYPAYSDITLRQYAAIKLKVPDSGTDWLDDMIRQSLKDDFAVADAMLKAREA